MRGFYAEEKVLRSGEGSTQWRGFCPAPAGRLFSRPRQAVAMQCNYTSIPPLLVNTLDQVSTQHVINMEKHAVDPDSTRITVLRSIQ